MIFFEKVTKRIAFAENFRYTVTRIALAICGFCALLPKQLTPRQGTKTPSSFGMKKEDTGNNLRPVRGRKLSFFSRFFLSFSETTYAPSGDENSVLTPFILSLSRNNLHPARGRKRNLFKLCFFSLKKQLTPRQGTKTLAC